MRASIASIVRVAVASPALAYWEFGHETVAEIAMANVKPATRARVLALLRHSALLDTPECLAATPAEASVWPDCVKKLGDRFKSTFSWHYQDVEICQPFDLKSACKDGNCAAAQIEKDVALLESGKGTTKERLTALVFLIHLVGDIHQPLHAADNHDRGGNDVIVTFHGQRLNPYGRGNRPWNLHAVWDAGMIDRELAKETTGSEEDYVQMFKFWILVRDTAAMAAGTPIEWARESHAIADSVVYRHLPARRPIDIGDEYEGEVHATLEGQLARAGMRLGALLNRLFP